MLSKEGTLRPLRSAPSGQVIGNYPRKNSSRELLLTTVPQFATAAPVDSFWKSRPTFVQAAHVARLGELRYDASGHRRKVIPKRDERRSEAKIAAQCFAEAATAAHARVGAKGDTDDAADGVAAHPGGPLPRPALAASSDDSDAEQLLEHAATMLLFTRAVAHERLGDTGFAASAEMTPLPCSQ